QLEIGVRAFGGARGDARDRRDRLAGDHRGKLADACAARLVPQLHEWRTLELVAEQHADARAGEPERMVGRRIEGDDEAVAEDLADRARLDVAAFGREPAAAPLIPIGEQLAGGRGLHLWPLSHPVATRAA